MGKESAVETRVRLRLFGPVEAERDGEPITGFESRKALALLGYLALCDHPVSRTHLADIFWPDKSEPRGRANLSRVLNNLSGLIPDSLVADRQSIQFCSDERIWIDVVAFDELVDRGDALALAQATDLYRGALMSDLVLDDCPEFEIWLRIEQERWQQRAVEALHALAGHHLRHGRLETSLGYARRLLELQPWWEEVHRLAMLLLALGGRRSEALRQFERCRALLDQELDVEPSDETCALCDRIREGTMDRQEELGLWLPSMPDVAPAPNTLPRPTTAFMGRTDEIARIVRCLEDPGCRLLTLVGLGGVGKTRLAIEAARTTHDRWPDGTYFVSLAHAQSPDGLTSLLAEGLRFSFRSARDRERQLQQYLATKELLVILDNVEHLVDASEILIELLDAAPRINMLLTSRQRLGIQHERVMPIEGLGAPKEKTEEALEQHPGVQLFADRARRVHPKLSWSERDWSHVAQLCRRVDGMPLALELAAAWVPTLSLSDIVAEIEADLGALTTAWRDVPERHRSLRAVFDRSWRMLGDREQAVFRRLGVFRGGFTRASAEAVAEARSIDLKSLLDKSLVRPDGMGRYHLHDLVRRYALERLQVDPHDADSTRRRHAAFHADFVRSLEAPMNGPDPARALDDLQVNLDNVHAGWRAAVDDADLKLIDRYVDGLFRFFTVRSRFAEGVEILKLGIDRLETIDDVSTFAPERRDRVLGRLCTRYGVLLGHGVSYQRARRRLEQGLVLAQRVGDPRETALASAHLCDVLRHLGAYDSAQERGEWALERACDAGDQAAEARAHQSLGALFNTTGDHSRAEGHYRESLARYRVLEDANGIATALSNLGVAVDLRGRPKEAERHYRESLETRERLGDRMGVSIVLNNLGDAAYQVGDFDRAMELFARSLTVSEEVGDRFGVALGRFNLGCIEQERGQLAEAWQQFRQALTISTNAEAVRLARATLVRLSQLLKATDRREHALELLYVAINHSETKDDIEGMAQTAASELTAELPDGVIERIRRRAAGQSMWNVAVSLVDVSFESGDR